MVHRTLNVANENMPYSERRRSTGSSRVMRTTDARSLGYGRPAD